jgi:DNA-binding response OmpR family regulator
MGRILLVDDNEDFCEALARSLAQEGYATCTASDVASALSHLDCQGGVELVIADLQLCRESGLDLCDEIRKRKQSLPVVLLSASPDASSYLEAFRLGAYEYLPKPVDLAELRGVLRRALDRTLRRSA